MHRKIYFLKAADWRIPHTGLMITRVAEFCVLAVFILGTVWLKTSKFGKVHPNVTDSVTPLAVIYSLIFSLQVYRFFGICCAYWVNTQ